MSIRPANTNEGRAALQVEGRPRETQESVVDAASAFDGLFVVGHNLRIEGEAKGEIQCDGTLTVAEGARVSATVQAVSVVVAGTLEGQITCRERLQILPSGRVSGTVTTNSLVIQEGALYEGELHMQRGASGDTSETPATTPPRPTGNNQNNRGRSAGANGRAGEPVPDEQK